MAIFNMNCFGLLHPGGHTSHFQLRTPYLELCMLFCRKKQMRLSTLVLSGIILLYTSCRPPQSFEYRNMKNLKIETVGFDKTVLSMDLVYYNPNGFGVDLKKVDCDVYVDRVYLGKYQLDTLLHIPRHSEFVLPSKMQVDMKTVLRNGLNFLFSQEVLLQVKGSTRVGKGGLYANIPFTYEARHQLQLF